MKSIKAKYLKPKSATEVLHASAVEWVIMPDTWRSGSVDDLIKWLKPIDDINKIAAIWRLIGANEIKILNTK